MARSRRGLGAGVAHFLQEFGLGHAGDDEVETQQIGIDPRGEEYHVIALDRLAHLGLQRIAVQDLLPAGAVLLAQWRGALKIEEKFAQPIVSHASILPCCPVPASGERTSRAGFALWSRCRRTVSRRAADTASPPVLRPESPSWPLA